MIDKQYIIKELERMSRQSLDRALVEEATILATKPEYDKMVEKLLANNHTQYDLDRIGELKAYQNDFLVRELKKEADIFSQLVEWLTNGF